MLALPTLVLVTTPSVTETGNKSSQQLEQSIRSLLVAIKKAIMQPTLYEVNTLLKGDLEDDASSHLCYTPSH